MIKTAVTVKRTVSKPLTDALKELKKSAIYVGIPRGSDGDKRSDGGPPNNELGWIHEKGAPAAGIPPRPFLGPGVESAKDKLVDRMGSAMESALKGDTGAMRDKLEVAALEAESAVKAYMSTGDFVPLKPATIKNRRRSRGTQSKRPGEQTGTASVRPLINTGDLRNAIVGIVHKD